MQVSMFQNVVVVTTTIAEINRHHGGNNGEMLYFSCGGFAATAMTQDHLQEMEAMGLTPTENDKAFYKAMVGQSYIFRFKEAVELLSEAETEAVMWHELGHIKCGHTQMAMEQKLRGVVHQSTMELEADAFAAKHVSKKTLASGITKLLLGMSNKLEINPAPLLMGAEVRERINALQ